MKAGIITYPGSNGDDDLVYALRAAEWEVTPLWHKDTPDLNTFDLVGIPGGFSFGDYLRCGAIAALSPIADKVRVFAERGGLVIGMCNGFQTLCEMRLLPGALVRNESLRFVCKDVSVKVENASTPWTRAMKNGDVVQFPIAHGDGRYIVDESDYTEMKKHNQILLSYVGDNPNGSAHAIAGICNTTGNVFGLMPHPERATDLRSRDGMKIWNSLTQTLREKKA